MFYPPRGPKKGISIANQLTGFSMRATLALNGLIRMFTISEKVSQNFANSPTFPVI